MIIKSLIVFSIAAAVACSVVQSGTRNGNAVAVETENLSQPEGIKGTQSAVFAGGCFWGMDAVFRHVKGVIKVRSGYAGGDARSADYEQVSVGDTGHAESVNVTFDPTKVSYVQLLSIFFSVAHDPTEVDRQGPDVGTQYRSVVFYSNDGQKKAADAYIDAINRSKAFDKPVATQVVPLKAFYEAEAYHQNYLAGHLDQPYIIYNDLPKLTALKEKFPDLYVEK